MYSWVACRRFLSDYLRTWIFAQFMREGLRSWCSGMLACLISQQRYNCSSWFCRWKIWNWPVASVAAGLNNCGERLTPFATCVSREHATIVPQLELIWQNCWAWINRIYEPLTHGDWAWHGVACHNKFQLETTIHQFGPWASPFSWSRLAPYSCRHMLTINSHHTINISIES